MISLTNYDHVLPVFRMAIYKPIEKILKLVIFLRYFLSSLFNAFKMSKALNCNDHIFSKLTKFVKIKNKFKKVYNMMSKILILNTYWVNLFYLLFIYFFTSSDWLLTFATYNDIVLKNCRGIKINFCLNLWHYLNDKIISKHQKDNLENTA